MKLAVSMRVDDNLLIKRRPTRILEFDMEAKEYLDLLKDDNAIIRLAHYDGERCDGRGNAVILDEEHQIAVMLENCGFPSATRIIAGAIVKFVKHPEAEPKIVGTPAYISPVVIDGQRVD